eukprot:m.337608 g.337608  ORF g.337608 m.337608 type:complete len:148 (+) comp18180_c0_seq1:90-533(+)
MRHRVHFRKLGRTTSHRISLLRTQTTQLIEHERIKTTVAKAKELRRPVEQMITLAKRGQDDMHARIQARAWVQKDSVIPKLFEVLGPRYESREGGYTRVLKAGRRHGDNAPMAYIEFIDNDLPSLPKPERVPRTKEQAMSAAQKETK